MGLVGTGSSSYGLEEGVQDEFGKKESWTCGATQQCVVPGTEEEVLRRETGLEEPTTIEYPTPLTPSGRRNGPQSYWDSTLNVRSRREP